MDKYLAILGLGLKSRLLRALSFLRRQFVVLKFGAL